jgi:hypothetical protein
MPAQDDKGEDMIGSRLVRLIAFFSLTSLLLATLSPVRAAPQIAPSLTHQETPPSLDDDSRELLADDDPAADPVSDVPQGVSADWWQTVQKDIHASEYHVKPLSPETSEAAYQAPNRAQNLRTYFAPSGIRVIPRVTDGAPPWGWGLTLSGYGYAGDIQPVSAAELTVSANRIAYHRGALTEWYVNDENGLEQGFTLSAPPQHLHRAADAVQVSPIPNIQYPIVLELTLSGNLTPHLSDDGSAIEFTTPPSTSSGQGGGVRVLRYADLHAYDAAGHPLPAHFSLFLSHLSIFLDATDAVYPITVDPLASTPGWAAESNQAGARFGVSVDTAGDVNGDGYSDVVIGARFYDDGQTDEGAIFVYHDSPTGPSTSADWMVGSNQTYAEFGCFVSMAGDVNRDGYADVVVGAAHYDNGQSNEGRAYVYHGSPTGLSAAPDWTVESNQADAYLGHAVSTAGDVNGDGYDDVLVGAYQYSNGQAREGRVYVYYGSDTGLSATADWIAESNQDEARMGYHGSGSAGDVNGDGYDDIIVGAFRYYDDVQQDGEGHVFIYHGSPTGLDANGTRPSGLPTNADWTAQGDQYEARFGHCVSAAGDVNSDGYSDVIIGARSYDNGQTDEGMAFVYHGSPTGLDAAPAWTVESNQDAVELGWSVSTAGDVNGDGYADVIVGAYGYDNGQEDEGLVYVYHGSPTGLHVGPADWTVEGEQEGAWFGRSVGTAGDVNGDGYSDVIVGASHYDNGQEDEGRAFVYYGAASGLEAVTHWTAESNQADALFGYAVDTAGDVNGDGYSDVVVGARFYDDGQTDEGAVFVYHGSPTGPSTNADWMIGSNQVNAGLGAHVALAGDVNGDGYSDVVAGAPTPTVTLSAASGLTITVDYASANGTALAGEDYAAVGDTLTFGPGVTSRVVSVPILDDALDEEDETLTLTLSDPVNATVGANNPATLTILDDDAPGMSLVAANDSPTALGQATTLTATVTGMSDATFLWTLGDGTSDGEAVVTHVYPAVGVYTATVIAISDTDALMATTVVTVGDAPITGLVLINDSPTTLGNITTLTATVTAGSNVTYTWDLGDGSATFTTNAGNGAVVGHTYPVVGEYTAVLTASNSVSVLTATTTVFVQEPSELPEYLLYLPLVTRNYAPPVTFPVFIGNAIPERQVAYRGEVFYSASVQLPVEPSPTGRFYFSSQQDAVAEVLVDDALFVLLDGNEVLGYPFSPGTSVPEPAVVEVSRSLMEEMAGRAITIEYRDLYDVMVGASAMWLIWVP